MEPTCTGSHRDLAYICVHRKNKMVEDLKSSLDHAFVNVCVLFGFLKLNKHQEEAIRYVVEMDSDVYVNLPTGYGKSVVFQASPIVFDLVDRREKNMVIVISRRVKQEPKKASGHAGFSFVFREENWPVNVISVNCPLLSIE